MQTTRIDYVENLGRRLRMVKLFGMIGKKKDSIEMQQFLGQLKKLEDFLKPLLGYDES